MRKLVILTALVSLPAITWAASTTEAGDNLSAVAYFTSGLADGLPVDRIDTAYLDQDRIILYVDWESMKTRAYRTEVRILDPNGRLIGKVRNTIGPGKGRYYTYYYFQPTTDDTPGDWTYEVYVDGQNAFEARIPILASE